MAYGNGRGTRRRGGSYGGTRRRYKRAYKYKYARPARARRSYRKKARRTGTRDASGACVCPGTELTTGEKFVLAQGDPFDPKCLGCKIPDSNTQPSIGIPCQELYSTSGSAANMAYCIAFLPGVTGSIVVPGAVASNSWSWLAAYGNAQNWNKKTDIVAACEAVRPVAHGLRISSSIAPTTATGFVHLALAVETNLGASTWQFATTTALMAGYSWYKRVTVASLTQSPVTIINKFVDETAFRYLAPDSIPGWAGSTGNTFQIPLSWGALLVAVEGCANAEPLQFEMMLHLEAIPKNTGVIAGSPAAPSNTALLASAAGIATNTDFAHTEDQQDSYMAQVVENAQAGAAAAGQSFVTNALRPAAYSLGHSLANQALSAGIAGAAGIMGVNRVGRLELGH